MPLPALVKVEIEKKSHNSKTNEWKKDEVYWVVTGLTNHGSFKFHWAGPETENPKERQAYNNDSEYKEYLYGAEYVGPWEGKVAQDKFRKNKFFVRQPGRGW